MLLDLSPSSLNPQGLLYINKDRGFILIFIIIGQLITEILFQILERFQHFTLIPFPIRIFLWLNICSPASQVPKQQNIQNQESIVTQRNCCLCIPKTLTSPFNTLLMSRMEASQPIPTFYNEALDLSLAPLMHHLTVLG